MKNRTLVSMLGFIAILSIGAGACSTSSNVQFLVSADSGLDKNSATDSKPVDASPADTNPVDSVIDDGTVVDSDLVDGSSTDTGTDEGNLMDSNPEDASSVDVNLVDSPDDENLADSGPEDTGLVDSPLADTSPADSSPEDSTPAIICPSCDELLTWDTTKSDNSSYGQINTSNVWKDVYAVQMLNACAGWDYFEGNKGGLGDTLEIASCNNGLVLVWAYEQFTSIKLSQGWTGTTNMGPAIGTPYAAFVQVYPGYNITSSMPLTSWGYASLVYMGGTATFENSALTRFSIY